MELIAWGLAGLFAGLSVYLAFRGHAGATSRAHRPRGVRDCWEGHGARRSG